VTACVVLLSFFNTPILIGFKIEIIKTRNLQMNVNPKFNTILIGLLFLSLISPNLNFAQRIPGRTEGRGIGIIDTRRMAELPDKLIILSGSAHWDNGIKTGMKDWLSSFVFWLVNSKHGKDEAVHVLNKKSFIQVVFLFKSIDKIIQFRSCIT